MNKNKFYCIFYVYLLSFGVSVSATMHTPSLPSGIKARITARKQIRELPKKAEGYIKESERSQAEPVGQESLARKLSSLEDMKQLNKYKEKQQEIEISKEVNNIYIYDESGNEGYRLTEKMWSKSKTLKFELESLLDWKEGTNISSQVRTYPYSADVIKTIAYILKACEDASKENPCDIVVKNIIDGISFQTVVSALICAHETLDIDKELFAELVKKVEQKIADLLNGNTVSIEDIQALDTMQLGGDLRKQLLGVKWEVLVEKFKLSVVKKCSYAHLDNQPKPYTYGDPGDSIFNVLFSPNNKYLFIDCYDWSDGSFGPYWRLKSSPVINMSNMHELKGAEKCDARVWIDNNTFICAPSHGESLAIFKCNESEVVEIKKFELTHDLDYVHIVHNNGIIMFSAWDSYMGLYTGLLDYNKPADEVIYRKLTGIKSNYSKIITMDSSGMDMIFKDRKNLNKIRLYRLKTSKGSDAQGMVKLDEIATFDGRIDSVVIDKNKNRFAAIAGKDRFDIGIYSFETKSYTLFKGNKSIGSLAFSPDGKIIIAACYDELFIISAITGEKIGRFSSAGGQVFVRSYFVAFSNNDGNTLAIGRGIDTERESFLGGVTRKFQEVFMPSSKPTSFEPNLLIWKLLPDKYVSIFQELQNQSLPFAYIKLLVSLCNRTEDNESPIPLIDDEEIMINNFGNDQLGLKIKNMLSEINYISFPVILGESIQSKINEWQE